MPKIFYTEADFLEWLSLNCDKCKKEDSCCFKQALWESHDRGDYQVDLTTAAAVGYFCKWFQGMGWSCSVFQERGQGMKVLPGGQIQDHNLV